MLSLFYPGFVREHGKIRPRSDNSAQLFEESPIPATRGPRDAQRGPKNLNIALEMAPKDRNPTQQTSKRKIPQKLGSQK